MRALPLMLALFACKPTVEVDDTGTAQPDDTGASSGTGHTQVLVQTISSDYSVGVLASVDLDDWTVTDEIVDTPGDSLVDVAGEHIVHIGRLNTDSLRIYEPGSFGEPELEFALVDSANPYDVELCEGQLFVAQLGTDDLPAYDPDTGALTGSIDLSDWADADGVPEAASMVLAPNGRLYVGLQNLDTSATPWAPVGGHVLEVDCGAMAVTESWAVNGADVLPNPGDPARILVDADGDGLYVLDSETGELSGPKLGEDDSGVRFTSLAAWGDRAVVVTQDADFAYGAACLDMSTWTLGDIEPLGTFVTGIEGNDRGEAWISMRSHWEGGEAAPGLRVYDIATCTERTGDTPVGTLLEPYDITFY